MTTSDIGILDDPTPAERALSMLRSACDIIGLVWPEPRASDNGKPDLALDLIVVEGKAAQMAKGYRLGPSDPSVRSKSNMCSNVSLACYWIISAMFAAKRGDKRTEERHARRAIDDHLSWVPQRKEEAS